MKVLFIVLAFIFVAAVWVWSESKTIQFDKDPAAAPPADFATALTGKGKPGNWKIVADPSAPSKPNVLAQTDADTTSYRFPVCIYNQITVKDVDVSVKFKPISGKEDQAAGIVWRYKDANNYYIARANALEGNVVMYKVQNGKRSDLKPRDAGMLAYGVKTSVPSGQWSTLRITAKGNSFEVYLNNKKQFDVDDSTFPDAGKIGVWTKADSVTYFDDLQIATLE
jgi:Domain of Unknown Function (DUF1080)